MKPLYAVRNKDTKEFMETPRQEVVFSSEIQANRALAHRFPMTQEEWEVVEVEVTVKVAPRKAVKAKA